MKSVGDLTQALQSVNRSYSHVSSMDSKSYRTNQRPSKRNVRYTQSRLQLGQKTAQFIKCPKCGMTYNQSSVSDTAIHKKYHTIRIQGKKWSSKWGVQVASYPTGSNPTPPSSSSSRSTSGEKIVMIRPGHSGEVAAAMDIMNLANHELNAPDDENDFWSSENGGGKAFVYVKNERAVGAITVEVLQAGRGRWLVYDTRAIVEKVFPDFTLGISRIWVCRAQRRLGIATKLIEAARENTIHGQIVPKNMVAWSQPSDSGGKLALSYNGVLHKSGRSLIPCYI